MDARSRNVKKDFPRYPIDASVNLAHIATQETNERDNQMNIFIDRDIAAKVLEVVDCGLSPGLGQRRPGFMCVEAAVCYALGLPHGDNPECVSPALRGLKIRLNDSAWSSNTARAKGLRRLALVQLGSKDMLDDREFARRSTDLVVRKYVPMALRAAASLHKDSNHKTALLLAADRCENEGTREAAMSAWAVAADTHAATYTAACTLAATDYAATAATYAATAAANAATYAATAATYAAAAATATTGARDRVLSEFAEDVVSILKDMGAHGCQWLDLTEAA